MSVPSGATGSCCSRPAGEKVYRSIEGRVQSEMQLADMTYDEAFTVRELGSVEEAKHLLDVGYQVIEKFSPNMLKLLAAMATFSRMVSAMAPVKPLRPQGFRLAQIASLAYLNQLVHRFLVTTAERFRLRVYILGRSFGLATRFLLDSTRRSSQRARGGARSGTRSRPSARTSRRSPTSRWRACACCSPRWRPRSANTSSSGSEPPRLTALAQSSCTTS